jgi:TonB family protein
LHQRTEYYEAVGSYSTLEQNPATVRGGRVPNSPFFINTFSLAATAKNNPNLNYPLIIEKNMEAQNQNDDTKLDKTLKKVKNSFLGIFLCIVLYGLLNYKTVSESIERFKNDFRIGLDTTAKTNLSVLTTQLEKKDSVVDNSRDEKKMTEPKTESAFEPEHKKNFEPIPKKDFEPTLKKNTESEPKKIVVSNEKIYKHTDIRPEFSGSSQKLYEFIRQNLKYPSAAQRANVAGKVFIKFIVEKDGSISEVEVQKGLGFGCDEEAIRLIKSMPKWKPGIQNGEPVRAMFSIPLSFVLE